MKKLKGKKLTLTRETLTALALGEAAGGGTYSDCPSISCACCSDPYCPATVPG